MKKIVINLSPQKEDTISIISQNVISYTPLAGLTAVFILALLLFLQLFIVGQTYKYKRYERKWKKWESKYNLISEIKKEVLQLKAEKQKLEAVVTPEYDTVLILGDIFSSLPKNIWFDRLDFKEETIDLRGYVVKWNKDYLVSVDDFINSLREKDYFSSRFSKINIRESLRAVYNGVETLKFIIECKK